MFTSKSSFDVAYCSNDTQTSIIKNIITDLNTVLFHVKINYKLQSDTEKPLTVRLWKSLKLFHVLGIFFERFGEEDLNADFIKFHGRVEDTINQFILPKLSKQTNCKQNWVDNEVKNFTEK